MTADTKFIRTLKNMDLELLKKHFSWHSRDKEFYMTEHFNVNKPDKSAEHSHMHLTSWLSGIIFNRKPKTI